MATQVKRLLKSVAIKTGDILNLSDAADLFDASTLEIVINVESAGNGDAPKLKVQHSATNEVGTWLDFATPAEADLSTPGLTWTHQDSFTRWVGWTITGTLETPAVVTVDLVGKG